MRVDFIQNGIGRYIETKSGLDQHRDYLGISKIPLCPRAAVMEYRSGPTITELSHRMCYAGYEQEDSVFRILFGAGIARRLGTNEVVAPFDSRLKGHVDGETVDGELLEIKSVSTSKFRQVNTSGRALFGHFIQVQLYMRYGPWMDCFIVYRCRETYEHLVVSVQYNPYQADKFEEKAEMLLAHIDAGTLPDCTCGRHNDFYPRAA